MHIEDFGDAEHKFKWKLNIQLIFPFQKWLNLSKTHFLKHFLTVIAYNNGKLHTMLHLKDFGDAEAKFKRKQKIQQFFLVQKGLKLFLKVKFFNIFSLYRWHIAHNFAH